MYSSIGARLCALGLMLAVAAGGALAQGRDTRIVVGNQPGGATDITEDGGGNIGPNLTDNHWIHGGSPLTIHDTIRNGVPSASMPAWGAILGPNAVQQVAAYVVTLRNTDVPDGKAPQGEVWSAGGSAPDTRSASDAGTEGP